MSSTHNGGIPEQFEWHEDPVEYGPDVPLSVRLERVLKRDSELSHSH